MDPKIKNKLEALLRMTEKNGATEDEAGTAMALAAALAAKHGIDLATLASHTAGAAKPKVIRKSNINEFPLHQTFAAEAAATLMGIQCRVIDHGKGGFEFIGREELVEQAEQIMFWLFRQIEELYKSALPRGMTKRDRAEFRRTFKPACAHRVKDRADNIMWELRTNEVKARAATGHNAIVVQGYYQQLQKEIEEFRYGPKPTAEQLAKWHAAAEAEAAADRAWRAAHPEAAAKRDAADKKAYEAFLRKEAKRRPRKERTMPTGSGTSAGYAAGDQVQLHKKVQ